MLGTASNALVGLLVSSTVFDDLLWDLAIPARSSDATDECSLSVHRLEHGSGAAGRHYQTRISDYGDVDRLEGDAALSAYAELYGRMQRKLFAAAAAERSVVLLKREYIKEHGIPARMFNAVRVFLEGEVSSVREQRRLASP